MGVAGFELASGDDIVLWWLGPGCQRAVVLPSWEQTRAAFDRAARTLPGAASGAAAIQTSMACLIEPGRPLVVHSRVVDDIVGLVRPFTVGNVAGRELVFTAAVEGRALRLPLLSADLAALHAATHALNTRAGRELPWQTFSVERRSGASSDFEGGLRARRAEHTARRQNASKSGGRKANTRAL